MTRNAAIATLLAGAGLAGVAISSSGGGGTVVVAAAAAQPAEGGYLPDPARKYPTRVLWGDQHVHTGWSMDAGVAGATLTPEDAVRFARGEQVKSNTGQDARLARPLDWIAVTDHSDGMGTIDEMKSGNPEFMADPRIKKWHDMMGQGQEQAQAATIELVRAQASR